LSTDLQELLIKQAGHISLPAQGTQSVEIRALECMACGLLLPVKIKKGMSLAPYWPFIRTNQAACGVTKAILPGRRISTPWSALIATGSFAAYSPGAAD